MGIAFVMRIIYWFVFPDLPGKDGLETTLLSPQLQESSSMEEVMEGILEMFVGVGS